MRRLLFLAGLVGCATAARDNPVDGDTGTDTTLPIDAPRIDAVMTSTLSQTSDLTVATGQSIACYNQTTDITREASWYRVFPLAAAGITGAFQVSEVRFGVESSGPGALMVQVRIGTYAGTAGGTTITTASITQLASVMVAVPPSDLPQLLTAPITGLVPANGQLSVEILAPDGEAVGNAFFIGSTAGAETSPAYLRAPDCMVTQPTAVKTLGTAGSVVLEVTGTH